LVLNIACNCRVAPRSTIGVLQLESTLNPRIGLCITTANSCASKKLARLPFITLFGVDLKVCRSIEHSTEPEPDRFTYLMEYCLAVGQAGVVVKDKKVVRESISWPACSASPYGPQKTEKTEGYWKKDWASSCLRPHLTIGLSRIYRVS